MSRVMHVIKIHGFSGTKKEIAYIDVDKIKVMQVHGRGQTQYGLIHMGEEVRIAVKEHTFQRVLGLWKARAVYSDAVAFHNASVQIIEDES